MFKVIPLTILQCILLTGGQVFLKFALMRMAPFGWNRAFFTSVLVNWQFAVCGLCFLMASLLWMYIVKVFPFSVAYPMVSMSFVIGMIAAVVFFHEQVSWSKWVGVLLIADQTDQATQQRKRLHRKALLSSARPSALGVSHAYGPYLRDQRREGANERQSWQS